MPFSMAINLQKPHPEQRREAVRLEGWEPVLLLPILRDAALRAAPQDEVVLS
jgi:hypothetical protein